MVPVAGSRCGVLAVCLIRAWHYKHPFLTHCCLVACPPPPRTGPPPAQKLLGPTWRPDPLPPGARIITLDEYRRSRGW